MPPKPANGKTRAKVANVVSKTAEPAWTCPTCARVFARSGQRHACGTGNRGEVLRNRPEAIVQLYEALERFVSALGTIEIVTRERYVLFRTTRIFADAVIMVGAVRIAIHLADKVDAPIFFKIVRDHRQTTHVAKLQTEEDLRAVHPYLREAHAFSLEPRKRGSFPRA